MDLTGKRYRSEGLTFEAQEAQRDAEVSCRNERTRTNSLRTAYLAGRADVLCELTGVPKPVGPNLDYRD